MNQPCARGCLIRAERDRLARRVAELTAEIDHLREQAEKARAKANCTCGYLRAIYTTRTGHNMSCREYVGPLEHRWARRTYNGTFGGVDHWCICGGWFRQGGVAGHGDRTETAEPICPRRDQDWRGPRE